jgi:hypothetical protein
MNRPLIRSTAFVRAARRLLKKQPQLAEQLRATLDQLSRAVLLAPQGASDSGQFGNAGDFACP